MLDVSEFFKRDVVVEFIYAVDNLYFHESQHIVFLKNKIKFSSRDRIVSFYKYISLLLILFCYKSFSFFTFLFFVLRVHRSIIQYKLRASLRKEETKEDLSEVFVHLIPINTFPYVRNVFDSTILIFQIICVFSYIYGE